MQASNYSRANNLNRKYLEDGFLVNRMYYQYIVKNDPEVYLWNKEILRYILLSDEEYQSSII